MDSVNRGSLAVVLITSSTAAAAAVRVVDKCLFLTFFPLSTPSLTLEQEVGFIDPDSMYLYQ